jgi:hypothetical protein
MAMEWEDDASLACDESFDESYYDAAMHVDIEEETVRARLRMRE